MCSWGTRGKTPASPLDQKSSAVFGLSCGTTYNIGNSASYEFLTISLSDDVHHSGRLTHRKRSIKRSAVHCWPPSELCPSLGAAGLQHFTSSVPLRMRKCSIDSKTAQDLAAELASGVRRCQKDDERQATGCCALQGAYFITRSSISKTTGPRRER